MAPLKSFADPSKILLDLRALRSLVGSAFQELRLPFQLLGWPARGDAVELLKEREAIGDTLKLDSSSIRLGLADGTQRNADGTFDLRLFVLADVSRATSKGNFRDLRWPRSPGVRPTYERANVLELGFLFTVRLNPSENSVKERWRLVEGSTQFAPRAFPQLVAHFKSFMYGLYIELTTQVVALDFPSVNHLGNPVATSTEALVRGYYLGGDSLVLQLKGTSSRGLQFFMQFPFKGQAKAQRNQFPRESVFLMAPGSCARMIGSLFQQS